MYLVAYDVNAVFQLKQLVQVFVWVPPFPRAILVEGPDPVCKSLPVDVVLNNSRKDLSIKHLERLLGLGCHCRQVGPGAVRYISSGPKRAHALVFIRSFSELVVGASS